MIITQVVLLAWIASMWNDIGVTRYNGEIMRSFSSHASKIIYTSINRGVDDEEKIEGSRQNVSYHTYKRDFPSAKSFKNWFPAPASSDKGASFLISLPYWVVVLVLLLPLAALFKAMRKEEEA